MKKKVYIIFNDGRRSFHKAEKFGELVTVMDSGYDSEYRRTDVMVNYIKERMAGFSDEDFILMIGEPTLCALVTNVAVELSETKSVNILRWDKIHMSYIPLMVDFSVVKQSQADFNIGEVDG